MFTEKNTCTRGGLCRSMTVLNFEKCAGSSTQIGYDVDGDINNFNNYRDIIDTLAKFEFRTY